MRGLRVNLHALGGNKARARTPVGVHREEVDRGIVGAEKTPFPILDAQRQIDAPGVGVDGNELRVFDRHAADRLLSLGTLLLVACGVNVARRLGGVAPLTVLALFERLVAFELRKVVANHAVVLVEVDLPVSLLAVAVTHRAGPERAARTEVVLMDQRSKRRKLFALVLVVDEPLLHGFAVVVAGKALSVFVDPLIELVVGDCGLNRGRCKKRREERVGNVLHDVGVSKNGKGRFPGKAG